MLGKPKFDPGSAHSKPWKAITRQVYAAVARSGGTARIDVFNGNYGMFRGIVAAVIVTGLAGAVSGRIEDYRIYGGLVVMLALALLRMHRFAVIYARELFVAFLLLDPSDAAGKAGDGASTAGEE
jgi:hypothetical protein